MNKTISAFQLGWIGIRVSKSGRAAKLLKRQGWIKQHPAEHYNRNAFNWMRPCRTEAQYLAMEWSPFAKAGLEGIAMWITDAQWGHTASVTDHQWQLRSTIEADFNSQWPTGRRSE